MRKVGYEGVFKKKTGDIMIGPGLGSDGCATFYNATKFRLLKKYEVGDCACRQSLLFGKLAYV